MKCIMNFICMHNNCRKKLGMHQIIFHNEDTYIGMFKINITKSHLSVI